MTGWLTTGLSEVRLQLQMSTTSREEARLVHDDDDDGDEAD